jgi:hypothetical protein
VNIAPTVTDVDNVDVSFGVDIEGETTSLPVSVLSTAPVGTTSTVEVSTIVDPSLFRYALVGTYGEAGVTLGVNKSVASSIIGLTCEEVFTDMSFSKATVRESFASDNFFGKLEFSKYLTGVEIQTSSGLQSLLALIGEEVELINFSSASFNGSAGLQAVPEPTTIATVGMGLLALVRRKKR